MLEVSFIIYQAELGTTENCCKCWTINNIFTKFIFQSIIKIPTMSKRPNQKQPRHYQRRLPHIQPKDGVFFITYNLNGSLPKTKLKQLKEERDFHILELKKKGLSPEATRDAIRNMQDFYFGKFDDLLDNMTTGPTHLGNPKVAQIVADSLHWMDGKAYKLVSYTIMYNHVHKIIYKTQEVLWTSMKMHKSYTGRLANKILDLNGQFWQHESYDHKIRNRNSFIQKVQYTLKNPEKAGLVKHWRDYPFSWVCPEFEKYAPK